MPKHTVTIRMGAAHWDASVRQGDTIIHDNFRDMDYDQRRDWYGRFMGSIRRFLGGGKATAPKRGRRRRGRGRRVRQ